MRKIAICDFDGTLSRGYISMEFLEFIKNREKFSKEFYDEQMEFLRQYKSGELSYDDWCYEWGIAWGRGLEGQKENEIAQHAAEFLKNFKKNIYDSSYEIIGRLKKRDYQVICLSVGASEVIGLAAKELGMDETIATRLEIKGGFYTGRISTEIHLPGGKEKAMKEIMAGRKFTLEDSFGFGDSEADIAFLKSVSTPVMLNSKGKAKEYAEQKRWKVYSSEELDNDKIMALLRTS